MGRVIAELRLGPVVLRQSATLDLGGVTVAPFDLRIGQLRQCVAPCNPAAARYLFDLWSGGMSHPSVELSVKAICLNYPDEDGKPVRDKVRRYLHDRFGLQGESVTQVAAEARVDVSDCVSAYSSIRQLHLMILAAVASGHQLIMYFSGHLDERTASRFREVIQSDWLTGRAFVEIVYPTEAG